jgi:hypothetical protein
MKRLVHRFTYAKVVATLAGGCLATLAFLGVAQAETVTVGASLTAALVAVRSCQEPEIRIVSCGLLTLDAQPPASDAVAEVDGTVTSWRVRDASALPGYSVNVARRNPDSTYTVTASSAEVTPVAGGGVETFATNLPIHAGEYVELNIPEGGNFGVLSGASDADVFEPGLAAGETRAALTPALPGPHGGEEVAGVVGYNADIESSPLAPAAILPTTTGATTANVATGATGASTPVAAPCVVPRLTAKKLKVAKKLVRKAGCKVGLVSTKKGVRSAIGKVVKQSPSPGSSVPAHTAISLKLA